MFLANLFIQTRQLCLFLKSKLLSVLHDEFCSHLVGFSLVLGDLGGHTQVFSFLLLLIKRFKQGVHLIGQALDLLLLC